MKIKIIQRVCFGCSFETKTPKFYEDDPETSWCDDCFLDEAKFKELKSKMPFFKKVKYRIVPFLPFK